MQTINFNNYKEFLSGTNAEIKLAALWIRNTGIPRLEKLIKETIENINLEKDDVLKEREEMHSQYQYHNKTIYCGWGTSIDNMEEELCLYEDELIYFKSILSEI